MAGKQILLVSPNHDVSDPTTGTGTRLASLGAGLAGLGNQVSVLVPERHAGTRPPWATELFTFVQTDTPYLTDLNPAFSLAFARALRARDIDVVHVAQPKGVCAARATLTVTGSDAALVYASQLFLPERAGGGDSVPAYKRAVGTYLLPGIERAAVACADCVTTVSETDRRQYVERFGVARDRVHTISSAAPDVDAGSLDGAASVRERLGVPDGPAAVFHGNYEHPPNAAAVTHIAEELAPAFPDVSFLLLGSRTPSFDAPNVYSPGFVDDLFSTLAAADFAVVPITTGGGTRTKVFDYMALGLPLVATPRAVRGIDVTDGTDALVRSVGEPFAEAVGTLAGDPDERDRMGSNLRALAERRYTWTRSAAELDGFYDRVLGRTSERAQACSAVN